MILCPRCQFVLNDGSAFCNHCGQPLQAQSQPQYAPVQTSAPPQADQKANTDGVNTIIGICVLCGVCGLFGVITNSDSKNGKANTESATASPTVDEGTQRIRDGMAANVSHALKENGCVNCSAYAQGETFVIKNPDYAPKLTAALILKSDPVKSKLRGAGFTKLRVYQDTSFLGSYFEYEIR